ncbi:hypothetical protein ACHAW5_003934 [Stephanodiscus triporus]|uniref:Uncharacterized protein n=1 Tax=Stephanodiscus triporus TaxID=2934178 RepID=A0ABD3R7N5_9STRA
MNDSNEEEEAKVEIKEGGVDEAKEEGKEKVEEERNKEANKEVNKEVKELDKNDDKVEREEHGVHEDDDDNDTLGLEDPTDNPADTLSGTVWSDERGLKAPSWKLMSSRSGWNQCRKGVTSSFADFWKRMLSKSLQANYCKKLNRFESRRKSYLDRNASSTALAASVAR